jgi:hypothetical protein
LLRHLGGVVDENVECNDGGERSDNGGLFRDIERDRTCIAAVSADSCDDAFKLCLSSAGSDDVSARLGEQFRDGRADAPAGAGD